TDFIGVVGIGGIVSGFKQAGFKGAVVGGGIGLVANLALWGALSGLGLPAVIISCAAGSFVSKYSSKLIFSTDQIKKLKDDLYKAVDKSVAELKDTRSVEQWVRKTVNNCFEEYETSIDDEIERFLMETSQTIKSVTADAAKDEAEKKQLSEDCDEALAAISRVTQMIRPIYEKIVVCKNEVGV
ncbi:MAG: hypothetical protein ACI4JB_11240, partial [Porcipelethomonas sp.]